MFYILISFQMLYSFVVVIMFESWNVLKLNYIVPYISVSITSPYQCWGFGLFCAFPLLEETEQSPFVKPSRFTLVR